MLSRVSLLLLAPVGPRLLMSLLFKSLYFPLFVPPALERTVPAAGASPRESLRIKNFRKTSESSADSRAQPTAVCVHTAPCPGH